MLGCERTRDDCAGLAARGLARARCVLWEWSVGDSRGAGGRIRPDGPAPPPGVTRGASDGCDGLHLDQKILFDQSVDDQHCIRWIFAIRKHFWKFAQAKLHEFLDILGVNQIGRELHDVLPGCIGGFKRGLQISDHLRGLRVKITFADQLALDLTGEHA